MKGVGASRMGLMAAIAALGGNVIPAGLKLSNALSGAFCLKPRGITFSYRPSRSKYGPDTPQGERECSRRRRQMARQRGQLHEVDAANASEKV